MGESRARRLFAEAFDVDADEDASAMSNPEADRGRGRPATSPRSTTAGEASDEGMTAAQVPERAEPGRPKPNFTAGERRDFNNMRRFAEAHGPELRKVHMTAKDFEHAYRLATPQQRAGMLADLGLVPA
jgi:hypothetical protein